MGGLADLIADALATARLTRLVIEDEITEPLRAPVVRWATRRRMPLVGELASMSEVLRRPIAHPKVAYLLDCPWCISFWVAGVVVLAGARATNAWRPVARALALSQIAGMVGS